MRNLVKKSIKQGFTLIELIVIIIILGIVALIAIPVVNNVVKESREKAYSALIITIEDAAYKYGTLYSLGRNSEKRELQLQEMVNKGVLKSKDLINPITNEPLEGCVVYYWDEEKTKYIYEYSSTCRTYVDASGANEPELLNNMIPIQYNGSNWIYADSSTEWYNYGDKQWANAVILNSGVTKKVGDKISEDDIALWFVWIPRYKYVIFNGNNGSVTAKEIDVTFESGTESTGTVSCVDAIGVSINSSQTCTDKSGSIVNGTSTYTHPAFTFGDKELTGIWVGKFENSGVESAITIKPNTQSIIYLPISNHFSAINKLNTLYDITDADSHLMKNIEWGAVAYLKQSIYGLGSTDIGINNNSSRITGCGAEPGSTSSTECEPYNTTTGMLASTTGNIYGVYDMSGGTSEFVMANMVDENGVKLSSLFSSSNPPDSKYYDLYSYNSSYVTHGRGKLGDATKETLLTYGRLDGGWYGDIARLVRTTSIFVLRGGGSGDGATAGIFYFYYNSGGSNNYTTSRSVLVKE